MQPQPSTEVYFIDKFRIPKTSIEEFRNQMNYNRAFIAKLPGYKTGEILGRSDPEGNLTVLTIAVWKDEQSLDSAKQSIQTEFRRINFSPVDFYSRLNIEIERDHYTPL